MPESSWPWGLFSWLLRSVVVECYLVGSCIDCRNDVNPILGGYCGGVPPLPIPNREVKPAIADGTAMQCGRVGSRLFLEMESPVPQMRSGTFLLVVVFFQLLHWEESVEFGIDGVGDATEVLWVAFKP